MSEHIGGMEAVRAADQREEIKTLGTKEREALALLWQRCVLDLDTNGRWGVYIKLLGRPFMPQLAKPDEGEQL